MHKLDIRDLFNEPSDQPYSQRGDGPSSAAHATADTDAPNSMTRATAIAINKLPPNTTRVELLTFIIKHGIERDFCDENLTRSRS